MPVKRIFLGWEQPLLPQVAQLLLDPHTAGTHVDLSHHLLVFQGTRPARRMLEILLTLAEESNYTLAPPQMVTIGHIHTQLFHDPTPIADDLTRRILWAKALRDIPIESLQALINPPPDPTDELAFQNLGDYIARVHNELVGECLDCHHVATELATMPDMIDETQRWEVLAQIQDAYLQQLKNHNLADPRLQQLQFANAPAPDFDRPITLIGIVQMPPVIQQILNHDSLDITAYIFAPEKLTQYPPLIQNHDTPTPNPTNPNQPSPSNATEPFDPFGCINIHYWSKSQVPLEDHQIHWLSRPADYPAHILKELAQLDPPPPPDDITLGLLDESAKPYLLQQLALHNIQLDDASGQSIQNTRTLQLLKALATFLDSSKFTDFASLLHHPDVEHYITNNLDDSIATLGIEAWQDTIDDYYIAHLQADLTGHWLGNDETTTAMSQVYTTLHKALADLTDTEPRPIQELAQPLANTLTALLNVENLTPNSQPGSHFLDSCQHIANILSLIHNLPESLTIQLTPAATIRLLIQQLADIQIPYQMPTAAVQMLGWLELPLDDAPHLFLIGFNEGLTPASLNEDPLLPNTIRTRLNLTDNTHRYARDVYLTNALLHSRKTIHALVAQWSANNEPLQPSRLLFATDTSTLINRARQRFDDNPPPKPQLNIPQIIIPKQSQSQFTIPELPEAKLPDHLHVTAFRDYLECPYRFYLTHILKLTPVDDLPQELSPLDFGILAHDVLCDFGKSDLRDSTNPKDITDYLTYNLNQRVKNTYGQHLLPAVRVQIAILLERLNAFADWQAQHAALGWKILGVEEAVTTQNMAPFPAGDIPFYITGKIDRIDHHPELGLAIYDYKTGDSAYDPDKTHRTGPKHDKQWADLQLPLYRHLAQHLDYAEPSHLGYILLPKDPSQVGPALAEWTPEDLEQADNTARDIIHAIHNRQFDPTDSPPAYDSYAAILQQQFDLHTDEQGGDE